MPDPFPGTSQQLTDMRDDIETMQLFLSAGGSRMAKSEDALHVSGDVGVMMLGVRQDTQSNFASDGDYVPFSVNSSGELRVAGSFTVVATDFDMRDLVFATDKVDVTGSVLALPSGASTSALQTTGNDLLTTIDADTGSILTSVQLIDNAISGAGFNITQFAGVGISLNTGVRDAGTLRVTIATNDSVPVTFTGSTDVATQTTLASALTSLQLLDNAISGAGFNITQLNGATVPIGAGVEATALRVTIATDSTGLVSIDDGGGLITVDGTVAFSNTTIAVTNAGTFAVQDATAQASLSVMDDWDNTASDGASVSGDVAHDGIDAGEPVKIGFKAVDLGATPTAVAAADRTNALSMRNGIQFTMAGHPNTLSQSLQVTDADGAQTDVAIITVAAGTAIVVTKVSVMADNANTVDVSVRIGFGTANTPAADAAQVILFHPGIAAGSGVVEGNGSGIIGIGASNEDLRVTCEDPVTGSINIIVTYFTVLIG